MAASATMSGSLAEFLRAVFRRPGKRVAQADVSARPPAMADQPTGSDAVAYHRVKALDGGWLTAEAAGDALVVSALDQALAVIAVIPAAMPHLCLLMAPDGRVLRLRNDPMRSIAVSTRLLQTDTRGVVRLRYPLGGAQFLTVHATSGVPDLRFEGDGNARQAVFCLTPIAENDVPAGLRAPAAEIGAAASDGLRATTLLARLRRGALRAELAETLVRVMPREEMSELARRLLQQASERALLRRAMPGDPWLQDKLPQLASWCESRAGVSPDGTAVSPASDEAMLLPASASGLVPAGLAVQALARRQVLPRRTACVLASARNEGAYLLDWVSYHLSIGFEHIFLYTNENEDGSDTLLETLARHGVVTLVRNARTPSIGPQLKGYTHALTMLPQILDFRWTAVLDLDEYVGFDARIFDSIGDFLGLQESQPVDAVALCWVMFAGLPGDVWSAESTLRRFTRRQRGVHELVKSLIRTRLFWYSQPHFPTATLDAPFAYRSADGALHHHPLIPGRGPAVSPAPSAEHAWINHYMLRTADEALWKWGRGRGDLASGNPESLRPLEFIASSFLDLAQPELLVEDRRVLDCARGQGAVLDSLLRLPGIADSDAALKASFASQLAVTRTAFLANGLPPNASDIVRHFRDLIADRHEAA